MSLTWNFRRFLPVFLAIAALATSAFAQPGDATYRVRFDATWTAEQAVRNYDPCISCSVHFLDFTREWKAYTPIETSYASSGFSL